MPVRLRLSLLVPLFLFVLLVLAAPAPGAEEIPLPEHPRPDFERAEWLNLNGTWRLRFDPKDEGEAKGLAQAGEESFPLSIRVPFPWGSPASGVEDGGDIAWYARKVKAPEAWSGKRVFLVVGACDWLTRGWLDGKPVGSYRGGYTPFELELTPHLVPGREHLLVLRVDDRKLPFKLEGKQGYGNARGIWQTAYLEARPRAHLRSIHFRPDIDPGSVEVTARLSEDAPADLPLHLRLPGGEARAVRAVVAKGSREARFRVELPRPRLWSLEDPYLHRAEAELEGPSGEKDLVRSYFGMREVSVTRLPGTDIPYIALNGRPIYLQIALDQAYHPEGFYTFPTDEFLREEILRSRRIGLNAIRVHVKVEMPRKLYWADRLGLLVMADVPNSWGEPDAEMRAETETALRGMIERDFNHPAIFSWVVFNETWGLKSKEGGFRPETQEWVGSMYRLAKSLDPTRLVEDNSPCNFDHVETDINTWHAYLPGWAWREHLDQVVRDTRPGSGWNYVKGKTQDGDPLLNSECGNVWGYEGSTGDVDWSWDYHIMMNEFRRHPQVCGWLYTEHHDVINEWNGYYRFDRSAKITGLSQLVPGMSLEDLHAPFYIAPGLELCATAEPGSRVRVPLWASFLAADAPSAELTLRPRLSWVDGLGRAEETVLPPVRIPFQPWMSRELPSLEVPMPGATATAILTLVLEDAAGRPLHRNFTTFLVDGGPAPRDERISLDGRPARVLRLAPASFRAAEWSGGHWSVLDGLKVNGAGAGHFEVRLPWPEGLDPAQIEGASFRAELGAKELFSKDRKKSEKQEGDFMLGKGTHDPSLNPNSYPMTDTRRHPSAVRVRFAGRSLGVFDLEDDPADHRGILSWKSQKRDRKLREAGSYGYLVTATVGAEALRAAAAAGEIVLRLEVDEGLPGGLAIYGERFGRYPLDPTLVFHLRDR